MQSKMVDCDMRITWAGRQYTPSSLAAGGEYDPRIPLVSAEKDRTQDDIVWNDVPRRLKQRLQTGMKRIELDCVAENAQAVLTFYEHDILEHVVSQEANSKQLRKLLARDAAARRSRRCHPVCDPFLRSQMVCAGHIPLLQPSCSGCIVCPPK